MSEAGPSTRRQAREPSWWVEAHSREGSRAGFEAGTANPWSGAASSAWSGRVDGLDSERCDQCPGGPAFLLVLRSWRSAGSQDLQLGTDSDSCCSNSAPAWCCTRPKALSHIAYIVVIHRLSWLAWGDRCGTWQASLVAIAVAAFVNRFLSSTSPLSVSLQAHLAGPGPICPAISASPGRPILPGRLPEREPDGPFSVWSEPLFRALPCGDPQPAGSLRLLMTLGRPPAAPSRPFRHRLTAGHAAASACWWQPALLLTRQSPSTPQSGWAFHAAGTGWRPRQAGPVIGAAALGPVRLHQSGLDSRCCITFSSLESSGGMTAPHLLAVYLRPALPGAGLLVFGAQGMEQRWSASCGRGCGHHR